MKDDCDHHLDDFKKRQENFQWLARMERWLIYSSNVKMDGSDHEHLIIWAPMGGDERWILSRNNGKTNSSTVGPQAEL